jgi:GH15 family glucan-1,4-alpha-glucosidase
VARGTIDIGREAASSRVLRRPKYKAISDYGIIGDLHSAALVGRDASIDWYCYPHFDSPSVFAALLDARKGGHFRVGPPEPYAAKQLYYPDTNILLTRFHRSGAIAELTDFMPVETAKDRPARHRIIRRMRVLEGSLPIHVECAPAFDYARAGHKIRSEHGGLRFIASEAHLHLRSTEPLEARGGAARARFRMRKDDETWWVLEGLPPQAEDPPSHELKELPRRLEETTRYWRKWIHRCTYRGRWREIVHRSALALKLLTFNPSGAIIAAPTCGLPEELGGERNWDYRYSWVRDASYVVYALVRIGFAEEAARFMHWLLETCLPKESPGPLHPLYTIAGVPPPPETHLDHLEGYRASRPVRIGNQAGEHVQLDIYGGVLDAVYLFNKYGSPIPFTVWERILPILDYVCDHWQDADRSIWEVRSKSRQFVYSKVLLWVALDRAIRVATERSLPAPLERWRQVRDAIHAWVMEKGYDEERRTFIMAEDHPALDAGALLFPLAFFVAPTEPRAVNTVEAIRRELAADAFVRRYDQRAFDDGVAGRDVYFSLCSFWLVEALTRVGQLEEARRLYETMLRYASPLGLFSEEMGPEGQMLGNFPQAFTHLALISATFNLDRALEEEAGSRQHAEAATAWRAFGESREEPVGAREG